MRRRGQPAPMGSETDVPADLAAGPVVAVWADPHKLLEHRAGQTDAFDLQLNAWGHWRRARTAWIDSQPDPIAAGRLLPSTRKTRDTGSLDVKQ